MDVTEILETYLNLVSKNTSETDIFPHGTNLFLTSVMSELLYRPQHLLFLYHFLLLFATA